MSYDEQYSRHQDVFGREPEKILTRYVPKLDPAAPVLDIGAGQGRNTLFLARQGFRIDAIDPSAVAVRTIQAAADAEGLDLRAFPCGVESFSPDTAYGGILLFGLIPILTHEAIPHVAARTTAWLAPRGLLFVTAFTTADEKYAVFASEWESIGRHSFASQRGDTRTFLEAGELPTLFPGLETVHHWEGPGPEHHHGDGVVERHAMAEAVLQRPA